jgi:hypothetical protein
MGLHSDERIVVDEDFYIYEISEVVGGQSALLLIVKRFKATKS